MNFTQFKALSDLGGRPIAYIPIEIFEREFHAKCLFALEAVKQGMGVVIGPKYDVNKLAEKLKPGVYFGIGFHSSAAKIARTLRLKGHYIVSQDEEGLVRFPDKFYSEYRVDEDIHDVSDLLLCWGESHLEVMRTTLGKSEKLRAVGNSRIDLLGSEFRKIFRDEVQNIVSRYGEFLLVNGNFGSANHALGDEYWIAELRRRGWFDSDIKRDYQERRIGFQKKILFEMAELVKQIASKGHKVIVRPHPSENLKFWEEIAREDEDNISIVREGNVLSWMLASKLVIHNGCTTAIEGRLLGKPVFSYRPEYDHYVESYLPNAISENVNNVDRLIELIDGLDEDNQAEIDLEPFRRELASVIDGKTASAKIMSLISSINHTDTDRKLRYTLADLIAVYRLEGRLFLSNIKNSSDFKYQKNKCAAIKLRDVFDLLQELKGENPQNLSLNVRQLTKHSVSVCAKRDA